MGDFINQPNRREDGSLHVCNEMGTQSRHVGSTGEPSDRKGVRDQSISGNVSGSAVATSGADLNKSQAGDTPVRLEADTDKLVCEARSENLLEGSSKGVAQASKQSSELATGCEMNYVDTITTTGSNRPQDQLDGDHVKVIMCGLDSEDSMPSTSYHQNFFGDGLPCVWEKNLESDLDREGGISKNVSAQYLVPVLKQGHEVELESMSTSVAESLSNENSGERLQLRHTASAPLLTSLDHNSPGGEEVISSSPVAQAEFSKDSPGLQRAQTMPSGSFEDADGTLSSNKKSNLMRSSTDKQQKGEGQDKDYVRTPGPKLSKRKRKKLMKRMITVKTDGTVEFDVDGSARIAPHLFDPEVEVPESSLYEGDEDERKTIPPLQIAMLIVGTRGDVQPFVAIGKHLQEHGHRVRLATHKNFRDFVLKAGLEFYPLGGDPKVLAGYMVKNKGFLPSGPSEIRTQRKQLKAIINSLLPACQDPDESDVPFKAQAIIANPPAYGHIHVAEALKVPLHIFFTMPWTPTSEFPHPLSRVHHFAANRFSYHVVDSFIWWGIQDIINDFRKKKLKLRPITYLSGSQLSVSKLPTGYMWSPHLVPRPKDWGPMIDVVGFCFLNLAQDYNPPDALVRFLKAGAAPIYVGFGSLPVEDPQGMTKIIVEALMKTSQRGIIDKGWGGIGNLKDLPNSMYLLENCPHDWLFPQCAAVVHHGGAGTTAAGLKSGCPTTIVPFFGDQPFWGERVHEKGVGPPPIPVQQFSLERLVHAINYMLDSEVKQKALELAKQIEEEDGVEGAVGAFYRHWVVHVPHSSPTTEPPSIWQTIWITFGRLNCLSCCT